MISILDSSDEAEKEFFIMNSETEIKVRLKELKSCVDIQVKKFRLVIRGMDQSGISFQESTLQFFSSFHFDTSTTREITLGNGGNLDYALVFLRHF
jgi:hypothetical protein